MRTANKKRLLGELYVQVVIGIVVGAAIGILWPEIGASLQPAADGFIKLIKMLLGPIVFGTVVVGIAKMSNLREVGRIGAKALIYFEIASTLALLIGLVVANVMRPGAGMNIDAGQIDASSISSYVKAAQGNHGIVTFFLDIIPTTIVNAFAQGAMLQIILISVLMGIAMVRLGERGKPLVDLIDVLLQGLFRIVAMVMRLAPIGAGAGMAFTIGKYGIATIWSLGYLMVCVYVTTIIFVVVVLASVAWWSGFPLTQFFRYFKDEILVVLGTCSTEAVMPQMLEKLERLGCDRTVVGMVLPTGYTFNADGTSIYLTMAALFVAQATNTDLSLADELLLLGVFLLTSKGSAGVAGAGFVTLAATLSTIHTVPVAGLVLLLGVDRFMNEARAVTNMIGNGVATIAIAKWEGAFDQARAREVMQAHREGRVLTDEKPEARPDIRPPEIQTPAGALR